MGLEGAAAFRCVPMPEHLSNLPSGVNSSHKSLCLNRKKRLRLEETCTGSQSGESANLERFSMWRKTPFEVRLRRRRSANEVRKPSCVSAFRCLEAKTAPSLSRSVRMTTFLEFSKTPIPLLLMEEIEAMRPLNPSLRRAFSSRWPSTKMDQPSSESWLRLRTKSETKVPNASIAFWCLSIMLQSLLVLLPVSDEPGSCPSPWRGASPSLFNGQTAFVCRATG